MPKPEHATDDVTEGGGNTSYRGYNYQKLVTVWIALELMFADDASVKEIIVEPASHDDVAARLAVNPDKADTTLSLPQTDLHVQIKLRGAGHWSAKEFASVVKDKPKRGARGPAARPRAKAMLLAKASRRYLFVTNVSVDKALSGGRVANPAAVPPADFLPTNLTTVAAEKASLAGRFAFIELLTPGETRLKIETLLRTRLFVPEHRATEAIDQFKRMVEDRLLGLPDPLRRDAMLAVAESVGGAPHPDPELARYEPPATMASAEALLRTRYATLLVGPPGYGKTLTAKAITFARRTAQQPFTVVREIGGPAQVDAALAAPGRHVFHLDDPWGQSSLDGQAAQWSVSLPQFLRRASPDKQFVITSRTDILRLALGNTVSPVWADILVRVDEAAYDTDSRRRLLHGKLSDTTTWRQDFAQQYEARILARLRSPMELDAFTRQLRNIALPDAANIDALIDRTQTDSRRDVIAEQVRGFGTAGLRGATILWALLRRSRDLELTRLRAIRRQMDSDARDFEIALDDLADHLAQTQFEVDENKDLRAHGKVVEALEMLVRLYPREAERTLDKAALALLKLQGQSESWLDEIQRIVDAARTLANDGVELSLAATTEIDRLFTQALLSATSNPVGFPNAWQAVLWRTSEHAPLGRLVRWLERGASQQKGDQRHLMPGWRPPALVSADIQAVKEADPTGSVLAGFIAHRLGSTTSNYGADDLLPWLRRFGFNFAPAFLHAAASISSSARFEMNADVIAEGALDGPAPPWDSVWAHVLALEETVNVAQLKRDDSREAWQGERDYAEQLHIQDALEEEGSAASYFAGGYVRARLRREGHEWIGNHPRHDLVLPLWADAMRYSKPVVGETELDAYFTTVTRDDRLLADGLRLIGERRLGFAKPRVLDALACGSSRVAGAAVMALHWLMPEGQHAENVITDLLAKLDPVQATTLAMAAMESASDRTEKTALARRLLHAVTPAPRPMLMLALCRELNLEDNVLQEAFRQVPHAVVALLIETGPRLLSRLLLGLSAADGHDVNAIAKQWLEAGDATDASAALIALAQRNTADARRTIADALQHVDFKVRREAMNLLAEDASAEERARILAQHTDGSAPVRARLAALIGEGRWLDGVPVLLRLLNDRRDYARHPERNRRHEPDYQVARTAAGMLANFCPLTGPSLDTVLDFLRGGETVSADIELHATLVNLLADVEHPDATALLCALMNDGRVIGEDGENLYPVRYAAAWALFHRLHTLPTERDVMLWDTVEAAVGHFDPQLAAPALCVLGTQLETRVTASALAALRGQYRSDARCALALTQMENKDGARDLALRHALLASDHPLLQDKPNIANADSGVAPWCLTGSGEAWLRNLVNGDDVERVLLKVMSARTGLDFGVEDFDATALRRRKSIPLVTLSEMFGME